MWTEIPDVLKTPAQRTEVERLAKDMMFQTIPDSDFIKLLESMHHEVRNVVIPLKYTVGVASGVKLLVSNSVMGSVQLFSR